MSRRAPRSKGAIVAGLILAGCARAPRAPETHLPPVAMEAAEVSSALDGLRRQADSIRQYQGLLRVRGRGPDGGFDARLAVLFERPEWLRVELLGAFGATRWSAVASGEEITVYFPGKRHYLREPDVADVVSRLLGVRLRPEDMMAALSGAGVPLDPSASARGYRRGEARFVEIAAPSRATVELGGDGQVTSARCESYGVSYSSSWRSRGRAFPGELTIESEGVRARIEASEVDVNVALDPGTFVLEVPADALRLRPAEVGSESVFVVAREPR